MTFRQGSQQAKTRQDQARLNKTALNPVLSRLSLNLIKPLDKRSSRLTYTLPQRPHHSNTYKGLRLNYTLSISGIIYKKASLKKERKLNKGNKDD